MTAQIIPFPRRLNEWLALSDEAWLRALFEFSVCDECGLDADEHEVVRDPFGLRLYVCLQPLPWETDPEQAQRDMAARCESI